MKRLKRIKDISKGVFALVVIASAIPFIIFPVCWYWVQIFKLFF